jgi:hypothetical protein
VAFDVLGLNMNTLISKALLLGAAATTIVIVAVFAASSLGGGDQPETVRASGQGDAVTLSGSDLAASLATASDVERPLLADGVLTHDEYGQAVQATVACLEGKGFRVIHATDRHQGLYGTYGSLASAPGVSVDDRGLIQYAATGGGGSVQQDAASVAGCKQASATVEGLWQRHVPPLTTDRPAMLETVGACLRARGYQLPTPVTEDDMFKFLNTPPVTDAARQSHADFTACDTKAAGAS